MFSYEFSRNHSYAPGAVIADFDPATAGSYHTSEVPFWLDTLDSFNRYRTARAWTADDRALSQAMIASLVAFARTGKPDTSTRRWPVYSPKSHLLLELGTTAHQAKWPDRRKFNFFRSVVRPVTVGGALRD